MNVKKWRFRNSWFTNKLVLQRFKVLSKYSAVEYGEWYGEWYDATTNELCEFYNDLLNERKEVK